MNRAKRIVAIGLASLSLAGGVAVPVVAVGDKPQPPPEQIAERSSWS